jgi:hypothetical protein
MMNALVFAGLLSLANGFVLPVRVGPALRMPTVQMMGVQDAAAACLEEGCSVDTIDNLIRELKKESNSIDMSLPLSPRQSSIIATIKQLQSLGADADPNALEKIIAAASRSFSVVDNFEFPGEPLGYTGKAGTTTTAGKALD